MMAEIQLPTGKYTKMCILSNLQYLNYTSSTKSTIFTYSYSYLGNYVHIVIILFIVSYTPGGKMDKTHLFTYMYNNHMLVSHMK